MDFACAMCLKRATHVHEYALKRPHRTFIRRGQTHAKARVHSRSCDTREATHAHAQIACMSSSANLHDPGIRRGSQGHAPCGAVLARRGGDGVQEAHRLDARQLILPQHQRQLLALILPSSTRVKLASSPAAPPWSPPPPWFLGSLDD
eukprot:6179145-Pleurochrysis_carterae.AAC.1